MLIMFFFGFAHRVLQMIEGDARMGLGALDLHSTQNRG